MPASELRDLLARALIDAGPDAPTLCEGWRTRHLAAHLVLREHESWRMAGLLLPSRRDAVGRLTIETGDGADSPALYGRLVQRFADGPGRYSPWRLIDGPANVLEYAVHLEDIVRAGGGPGTAYPPALQAEIWRHFAPRAKLMFRGTPARLALQAEVGGHVARAAAGTMDRSLPLLLVTGPAIDIVLLAYGRPAGVEIQGPQEAAGAFLSRRRGF